MNALTLVAQRLLWIAVLILVSALTAAAQEPAPLPSDALFNPEVLQRIDIRIHTDDWEKLKQNFQENTYYPADFVWNGNVVRNVGIRSRGFGSRSATKPGLRVDFDRYSADLSFLNLKSLVLDNLTQDHSGIHETVAMRVFARLGIPAPRETHARLYVKDEYVGLYAVVESIDKQFLARIYGSIGEDTQNDGYLYEFNYVDPWTFGYLGSEFEPYALRFDPKTHEKESDVAKFGPIENIVRLVNELPIEQFNSTLNEHLDLQAFMRFIAAQNFVGENDGFLGYEGINNFYFYRRENSAQHVFIAWDDDNAFWGPEYPIDMRLQDNVLTRKAMQVPELRDTYYNVLAEAIRLTDEPIGDGLTWLEHEIRRQATMIQDAMREDPSRPYSFDEHETAFAHMISFARGRSRYINEQMGAASSSRRRP
jgi:spore coat protein CotH